MYKTKADSLSETVLGEAVLFLLKEQVPLSADALYRRLQTKLREGGDELRRAAIVVALWDVHAIMAPPPPAPDAPLDLQDSVVASTSLKH